MKVCRIRKTEALAKSQEPKHIKDSRKDSQRSVEISYSRKNGVKEDLGRKFQLKKTTKKQQHHVYEPNAGKLRKMTGKS